jgi:transposase InsO family protein
MTAPPLPIGQHRLSVAPFHTAGSLLQGRKTWQGDLITVLPNGSRSAKQKPRGRLWLNDGFCIRLRPERRNHVWSYDFVEARTHDGRSLRLLTMIDEYTRECLAIRVARRLNSAQSPIHGQGIGADK